MSTGQAITASFGRAWRMIGGHRRSKIKSRREMKRSANRRFRREYRTKLKIGDYDSPVGYKSTCWDVV